MSLLALVGLASCSESDEYAEYANWELKNTQYIDSIAVEAAENSDGEWKRFVAVGLNPDAEWVLPISAEKSAVFIVRQNEPPNTV